MYKTYSPSQLQIEPLMADAVLTMFLYYVSVLYPLPCKDPCCLWRVRELSDFIKNIVICVAKMNEGLMGLERHEGE